MGGWGIDVVGVGLGASTDVWGWVDPDDSTEYALVGLTTGVSIVSLADPANATEVAFMPGANSTWRDIKTWGNYAYVTNEKSNGVGTWYLRILSTKQLTLRLFWCYPFVFALQ